MPRSQRNDNFIDKTFTIVADILLRIIPTTQRGREAFTYYKDGAVWFLNPKTNECGIKHDNTWLIAWNLHPMKVSF